ncbi:MAG: Crp/Fnr family transcriptional regulator [Burkholderiales bacterium]|nr:Crp/Fnr family transcriptional regulator [Burkholderiales bacterium]
MVSAELDRPALTGLRAVALLEGLGDDVLAEVAQACRFHLVRARQTVMSRADVEHDCCFVLSGRLRVVALSPGGREVSFRDAVAGETIGEMAALDGRPRSATVVALQESVLARMRAADLKLLLRRHWPICERMLQHLARTARTLTERVYELSTLNVQQRLCAELLRLATSGEAAANGRVVLHPTPSHNDLATRISSGREQVAREMAELARQGVIHREREHDPERHREREVVVIEDLRRLAERIEGASAGP